MTENKRFELQVDVQGKADIIDWVESKEKNAICIYNDLGVLPFSSAKAVCDKLNEQDKRIKELEEENASMKGRIINAMIKSNQVECNCTTCVCEDYVNEELKRW